MTVCRRGAGIRQRKSAWKVLTASEEITSISLAVSEHAPIHVMQPARSQAACNCVSPASRPDGSAKYVPGRGLLSIMTEVVVSTRILVSELRELATFDPSDSRTGLSREASSMRGNGTLVKQASISSAANSGLPSISGRLFGLASDATLKRFMGK